MKTRTIKHKTENVCYVEGCKFFAYNKMELHKHYVTVHSLKEQIKATLVIKVAEYTFVK